MTRTELIDALAAETHTDRKDAKLFLEALTSVIYRTIRDGGEIPLKDVGKFKVQNRKARMGRNPLTGAPVEIQAKTMVKFTMAKPLKTLL